MTVPVILTTAGCTFSSGSRRLLNTGSLVFVFPQITDVWIPLVRVEMGIVAARFFTPRSPKASVCYRGGMNIGPNSTALTFIAATLVSGSQGWGVQRKKLLISGGPVLSCDSRTLSVVVIWPDGLISPIGLISSEIFLKKYSPSAV